MHLQSSGLDIHISTFRRNEEVDEKALIKKLRKRVAELESELSCLLMAKVSQISL